MFTRPDKPQARGIAIAGLIAIIAGILIPYFMGLKTWTTFGTFFIGYGIGTLLLSLHIDYLEYKIKLLEKSKLAANVTNSNSS